MHKEISGWLYKLGYRISNTYLKLRLESHPFYPSLLSVEDTLSEFGINTKTIRTDKENLKKISDPILAHFNNDDGEILYFNSLQEAEAKVAEFDKQWTGIVMLAVKSKEFENAKYSQHVKKEKRGIFFRYALLSITSLAFLIGLFLTKSVSIILLTIGSSCGLYISCLIAQKELGISNSIADKICNIANLNRCESVLFSKGSKLLSWLSWGDIGIIYFSSSILYLLLLAFSLGQQLFNLNGYLLISFATLVFPIYSIYYQWKVVRHWCILCIGVLLVLFFNGATGFIVVKNLTIDSLFFRPLVYDITVFTIIGIFVFLVWQLLKSMWQGRMDAIRFEIQNTWFKRNPDIFNSLVIKEGDDKYCLPMPSDTIKFGNPNAPFQILMICSPYCNPCVKAHRAFEKLFEKYADKIYIAIRFALTTNNYRDSNANAAREILRVARQFPQKAISDWFSLVDLKKYKELYKPDEFEVIQEIDDHISWCNKNQIKRTPTIFINGFSVPAMYSSEEITGIVEFQIQDLNFSCKERV